MLSERTFSSRICFIAIFLYPLIFFWQCGDLTDTGFLAYNYGNFSKAIQEGSFFSETIVTNFVGYNWMRIFPGFEILGLKILYIIMTYFSVFLAFHILKKYSNNRNILLFSLLISELIFVRCISFTFNKDIMSWSLILASMAFLTENRLNKKNLFLSGFIIIFAIFSRLPNAGLIPIYILFLYFESKKHQFSLNQFITERLLYFILGLFIGLLFFNLILWRFHILDQFYQNFSMVKKSISNEANSYSIVTLLKIYTKELIVSLKQILFIFPSLVILNWLYVKREKWNSKIPYFTFFMIFCFVCIYYYQGYTYSSKFKYLPLILCSIPLYMGLLKNKELRYLILLFCFVSFIQVFGSNTGLFLKLSYGSILLIPTAIIILCKEQNFQLFGSNLDTRPILNLTLLLVGIIALGSRVGGVYHVTEGLFSRFECTNEINVKKMYGIYTTKERKAHIETLTNAIEHNCLKSKKVFIYGHQPLFYFLTNTKPIEGTAWLINKVVSEEKVFTLLNSEIQDNQFLIVDTKEDVFGERGEKDLKKFLQKHNYRKVSETPKYVIWKIIN